MRVFKEDLQTSIWRRWNRPVQEGIRSKLVEEGNRARGQEDTTG